MGDASRTLCVIRIERMCEWLSERMFVVCDRQNLFLSKYVVDGFSWNTIHLVVHRFLFNALDVELNSISILELVLLWLGGETTLGH